MTQIFGTTRIVNSLPQLEKSDTTDHACDVTNIEPGYPYFKKVGRSTQYVFDSGEPRFEGQVVLRWQENSSADYWMYVVVVTGQDDEGADILEWVRVDLNDHAGIYSSAQSLFDPITD